METKLKKVIQEKLNEEYNANIAFRQFITSKKDTDRRLLFINYLGKIIKENQTENELKEIINGHFISAKALLSEQAAEAGAGEPLGANNIFKFLSGMFNNGNTQSNDQSDSNTQATNWKGATGRGLLSGAVEYIIKKILSGIGVKGPLATAFSIALSSIPPRDLIVMITRPQYCVQVSPKVAGGVIEAFIGYIIEASFDKEQGAASIAIRNVLMEAMNQQSFMVEIGKVLCKAISGIKSNIKTLLQNRSN